jgi:hypothetical protein
MIERLAKLIGTLLNMQLTKVSDPTNFDVIVNVLPQLSASWAETSVRCLTSGRQSRMSVSEGEDRLAKVIGAEIEKMRRGLERHRESLEIAKPLRDILGEYSRAASIPAGNRKETRKRGRK